MAEAPWKRAGFANQYAYTKARAQAREWSDKHSRVESSKYRSSMSPETFRAYFDAFASGATGMTARRARAKKSGRRHLGPSKYVKHYLINVTHTYTADDYPYSGLE